MRGYFFAYFLEIDMALRNALIAQPHLYITDTNGRPLDGGKVYFGQVNKDPELYPVDIFYDDTLTTAAVQPVRTKNGFMNAGGDNVLVYAREQVYSLKVVDAYGRQVYYIPNLDTTNAELDKVKFDTGITVTPLGTGGISKNLHEKLKDSVSVKDFGATGDGVTDDTESFRKAMTHINTVRGDSIKGGTLYIPAGTYNISSTIEYPAGGFVSMLGEGKSSVVKWTGDTNSTMFSMDKKPDDEKKISIEKISFVGDDARTTTAFEINKTAGYFVVNLTFSNNYFRNLNKAIAAANETDQVAVRDNYFLLNNYSIYLTRGLCSNWFINNNHFRGIRAGGHCIYSEGGSSLEIQGNTMQTGAGQPHTAILLKNCSNARIIGAYLESGGSLMDSIAVELDNCINVTVSHLETHGSYGADAIIKLNNCEGTTLSRLHHSISGGSPTTYVKVTGTSKRNQLVDRYITGDTLEPVIVGELDFSYVTIPNRPDYFKTNKLTAMVSNHSTMAAFGYLKIIPKSTTMGYYSVFIQQDTEKHWSHYVVGRSGITLVSANTANNTVLLVEHEGDYALLNNFGGVRTFRYNIKPLSAYGDYTLL